MQEIDDPAIADDLDDALASWRDHLTARAASTNTIEAYDRDWRQLCRWLAQRLGRAAMLGDIRRLDPLTFRAFLAHRRRLGVENRSLARTMSSLRQFFRWLESSETIKNHAILKVGAPRVARGLPRPLTIAKAADVVEADMAAAGLRPPSGVVVHPHVLPGDPSDALLMVAHEVDADLIVVGNKGMRGAGRVLGSVPSSVAHGARCSVLIAHTTG
jgi:site-specific recombinase XerC